VRLQFDNAVFDHIGVGPFVQYPDNIFWRPGGDGGGHCVTVFGTDSKDFTLGLIRVNSVMSLSYDEGNGWQYAGTISLNATGAREWVQVAFAAKRPRRIKLEGFNYGFAGVIPAATTDVFYRALDDTPLMLIVGDSYVGGTGSSAGDAGTWASACAKALGFEGFYDGVGGSGWLTAAPGDPASRVASRGQDVLKRRNAALESLATIDAALYALGYNDAGGNQVALRASIAATVAACRVKPAFIGPWTPTGDTANLTTVATSISTAAQAAGLRFVDIRSIVTAENEDVMTGVDNVHPTQYGHNWLGYRVAQAIRAAGVF